MKTILVPTDFSLAADYAVLYAIKLAGKFDATIVLYHAFIPFESGFSPEKQNKKENALREKNLMRRLLLVKKKIALSDKTISVGVHLDRGSEGARLIEFCRKRKFDLIVMGTKGASGLHEILIGSFTSYVISKALCPVLAIPLKCTFKIPKEMIYASDCRKNETKALRLLAVWCALFRSKLSILHIESNTSETSPKSFNAYKRDISKRFKSTPITFYRKHGDDISGSILRIASKNDTNILAMSPIIRDGYWDRLLHKSVTRRTVHHIKVPLLSIPIRNGERF